MAAKPSISLFDVFIGRGRTIRNPTGPPGTHWRDPNKPSSRKGSAAASAGGCAPSSDKNGTPANSGSSNKSKSGSEKAGSAAQNGDAPKDGAADGTAENEKPADASKSDSNKDSNGSKKNSNGSKGNNSNQDSNNSNKKKGKKNKNSPAQSFTEEQDIRLVRLVGEEKTWREIAKELHKPQTLLQKRYKEIDPFKNKNSNDKTDNNNNNEKPSPKDSHKHKHKHTHQTYISHQDSHRTHSIASHAHSVTSTAYTLPSMISLTEDDNFTYGEIAAISELIERDMGLLWDRVSAGFYDMTGRRVAAGDIRGKFGGLGGGVL